MPGLTPGRRFQPPYYGFTRARLPERMMAFAERRIKGALFGCRMCGNCLLQETAYICPMECPKGLRNGPCGGSTPDGCYVDSTRPCMWHRIYERAERMGRTGRLMEVLPPLDWSRAGHETWLKVARKTAERGWGASAASLVKGRDARRAFWEPLFREIRQPWWWSGDDQPHPAPPHQPVSGLEEKLANGPQEPRAGAGGARSERAHAARHRHRRRARHARPDARGRGRPQLLHRPGGHARPTRLARRALDAAPLVHAQRGACGQR